MPEWGGLAYLDSSDSVVIAVFESSDRYWRIDLKVKTTDLPDADAEAASAAAITPRPRSRNQILG